MNYTASKAGIIGLTKSIAKEYGNRGVLVNAVAPGFIKSDMTNVLSDAIQAKILKDIPLGMASPTKGSVVSVGPRPLALTLSCGSHRSNGLRGGGRGRGCVPRARPGGGLHLRPEHRRGRRHDLCVKNEFRRGCGNAGRSFR